MKQEIVQFMTDEEEEVVKILLSHGFLRRTALVLVFLGKTGKATSISIGHGTDLPSGDVSVALRDLMDRGLVRLCESSPTRGSYSRVYELSQPFPKIIGGIMNGMKEELKNQIILIRRMKEHFR